MSRSLFHSRSFEFCENDGDPSRRKKDPENTGRTMKKITVGILGGMGPEATAYFFECLIEATDAGTDQDHVPVLLWSNPRIPDRTEAILRKGRSPLPLLLEGVDVLESGGAGLIVMPCITAHHWSSEIAAKAKVPFINLLDEAVRAALAETPGLKKAGLVASSGTIASGLWHEAFGKREVAILAPNRDEQEEVMAAIFGKTGIKAGFTSGPPRRSLINVARRLARRGAEVIIAGCTEVPLVLQDGDLSVPLVEPMRIAARVCVRRAGFPAKGDRTGRKP